jgi:hypothetical protein
VGRGDVITRNEGEKRGRRSGYNAGIKNVRSDLAAKPSVDNSCFMLKISAICSTSMEYRHAVRYGGCGGELGLAVGLMIAGAALNP